MSGADGLGHNQLRAQHRKTIQIREAMGRFPDYELFCGAPAREPSPAAA